MKSKFSWYFKPSAAEIEEVWNNGILTVDANVLLDMYRYHENTRKSLLESVQLFKERLWISHQAASEFLKNRATVIVSYKKSFSDANEAINSLEKSSTSAIQAIKATRIIPEETIFDLRDSVSEAIKTAREKISAAEDSHPNYLENDPLLEKIMELFENSVGSPFPEDEIKKLIIEAERRVKEKIPPGYMDAAKDGHRPYGDFFLWKQILEHAKNCSKPIILVTSDRKDDWWERPSGTTVGPRHELLKEASEIAGQKILIYQTDHFLKTAANIKTKSQSQSTPSTIEEAIEEIRAVDAIRVKTGSAVRVLEHFVDDSTPMNNEGFLVVEISRPLFMFTASGHFHPELMGIPKIDVRLAEAPNHTPAHRLNGRTGTTHDFNIHMKSIESNIPFPEGIYIFEYKAFTGQPSLFRNQ